MNFNFLIERLCNTLKSVSIFMLEDSDKNNSKILENNDKNI